MIQKEIKQSAVNSIELKLTQNFKTSVVLIISPALQKLLNINFIDR
jgi:hypothetical protein